MILTPHLFCDLVAAIIFFIAAFWTPTGRWSLLAAGLFFVAVGEMFS